jgi:demethylmenaquinone methyltransferase/2-methoxy-6-polyprenyl-1,4-benzoquinol methylase
MYVRWMYNVWSRFYDWSIQLDPAYRRNARRMLDKAVTDDDRVLDVGVGTGMLPEIAAGRSSLWTGLDYSGAMLAQAARKMALRQWTNVGLTWGDARHLPFDDGAFDAVVSSFVLPHFSRDERSTILAEMRRVMRPGGRLGLFLAQGERAPLFDTRDQLLGDLGEVGYRDIQIEDRDDVYRVVTAVRA